MAVQALHGRASIVGEVRHPALHDVEQGDAAGTGLSQGSRGVARHAELAGGRSVLLPPLGRAACSDSSAFVRNRTPTGPARVPHTHRPSTISRMRRATLI